MIKRGQDAFIMALFDALTKDGKHEVFILKGRRQSYFMVRQDKALNNGFGTNTVFVSPKKPNTNE